MADKYVLNGFAYAGQKEYEKAKKEQEVVDYICSNTNLEDDQVLYQLYEKLLNKGTLQTMVGYQFLWELRATVLKRKIVPEDQIRSIPIVLPLGGESGREAPKKRDGTAQSLGAAERYQVLYEKEKTGKTSLKIVIGFLAATIVGMILVAQFTPYSIFTNYENKIVNQYEEWQTQLEKREAAVEEKEQQLGIEPDLRE